MAVSADVGSIGGRLNRNGLGQTATSSALVVEPPLANNVTFSPKLTSSSGEPGNHALGSAVVARRHAFGERRISAICIPVPDARGGEPI